MTDELKNPSMESEQLTLDIDALGKVREAVQSLSKYIHGKKIYAKNNPTLIKFAEEFRLAFQTYFEVESEMVLAVNQYTLQWREQIVYSNEKRDESLAFLLYKDGVGELAIQEEVPFEELDALVDIIKEELHNSNETEDVVTRLWKADFGSIYYRVLDEYLVGEFGEGKQAQGEGSGARPPLECEDHSDLPSLKDKGRDVVDTRTYSDSIEGYMESLVDQSCPHGSPQEREEVFQSLVESFFTISSYELRLCQEEVAAEKLRDALIDFLESILEFTMQDNQSALRDLYNIIDCITDYIRKEANPARLAETLLILRVFRSSHDLAPATVDYFLGVEEKFSDTEYLHGLSKSITSWSSGANELFAYYRQVGKRAVPSICALMEEIDNPKAHRAACDVLIDVAHDDLPRIIESLNLDNERVARAVVYLLREMETNTIPPLVNELMFYPEQRVREEVIEFLSGIGSEDAAVMLVRMLDHSEKSTRMKTLAAMETLDSAIIANKLVALAFDKELADKRLDEQEHVFRALGKVVGVRALPHIRQMLEKRSRFGFGGQGKNDKMLAVRALEHILSRESIGLLQTLATDSNGLVKAKALRALKSLQTTMRSSSQKV
jgi:hypothetical protein